MGAWPDQASVLADLRRFLNDGPEDRPVKGKPVVGRVDGVNKDFITWDDRLVAGTLRVMDNNAFIDPADITVANLVLGEFTLKTAPALTHNILAVYFFQFFLDTDLVEAIQMSANQIVESDDVTLIAPGLKLATMFFAAGWCWEKQSIRWAQRLSNRFRVEDEPVDKDVAERPKLFKEWADDFLEKGITYRDDFYKRHGRRNVPSFGRTSPSLPSIAPRR